MDMASDVYIMFSMLCSNMINATNAHGLGADLKVHLLSCVECGGGGGEGRGIESEEGSEEIGLRGCRMG